MRDPGIEPESAPWQGAVFPLDQPRDLFFEAVCLVGEWTVSHILVRAATAAITSARFVTHRSIEIRRMRPALIASTIRPSSSRNLANVSYSDTSSKVK